MTSRWTSVVGLAALGVAILLPGPLAYAVPFSTDPIDAVKDEVEKQKSEKEKETEERLKAFEADQAKNEARVVVIQWQNSELNYNNELLQRNIKARTTRSNAIFVPDVDLYQQGRREPDSTLRPLDQRASVPDSTIDQVNAAVDTVSAIPWDGLPEQDWGQKAAELKSLSDEIWFVDRKELREPLFRLYSQIGRAAENANNATPPYYEEVGGKAVNYYYYLAAAMATRTPDLMASLHNPDLTDAIENLKGMLDRGEFATLSLNFEMNGVFDARKFTSEYKVFIDGVETQIANERALHEVPAGRADVYLERGDDGHGLSVRVEEVRVDAHEIYSVREQARKRVGLDLQKQLMKNKNQCLPEVDDDVLTFVAIYQKLHPGQEIYIAVPEGGSVNRIFLWKWLAEKGQLVKIEGGANSFPVRFVGLLGSGVHFGGASFRDPFQQGVELPGGVDIDTFAMNAIPELTPSISMIPFSGEIRGHWDRLMIGLGAQFGTNVGSDGWIEIPVTGTRNQVITTNNGSFVAGQGSGDRILLQTSEVGETNEVTHPVTMGNLTDGNGYSGRRFNRSLYATVGGVFLRDAASGFGPRAAVRAGLMNAPHAVDLSVRAGWAVALKPKKARDANKRIQGMIDTELFGGFLMPYGDTLRLLTNQGAGEVAGEANPVLMDNGIWGRQAAGEVYAAVNGDSLKKIGKPILDVGLQIKAGITF